MDELLASISEKTAALNELRPLSLAALRHLQKSFDVELTYTSNAIEGNTLTLRETAEVIEHGITVGGKSLRDHLEAADHYQAVLWMREIASQAMPIDEPIVRALHARIVARSEPEIAGIYSPHRRRVAGSPVVFPNPLKVPELMAAFGQSLAGVTTPAAAFDAHFRLTAIHPFSDGNGRTARLLMNLLLLRLGLVPIAIRPEDRRDYLAALEHGSLTDDLGPFQQLMHERLDMTLAEYIALIEIR